MLTLAPKSDLPRIDPEIVLVVCSENLAFRRLQFARGGFFP